MRLAVGQFEPGPDPAANLTKIGAIARRAAGSGAELLVLPEGSLVRFIDDPDAPARCAESADGPFGAGLAALSTELGIVIVAGSFTPYGDRVRNTLLFGHDGLVTAGYHKLHLYDAFSFVESDGISPGRMLPPVIPIGGVMVGFATCYDLRFPEVFRSMIDRGAQVLVVPAAWVAGPLKEEHWLTLLRARAIENTSYVVGAGQAGRKVIGRSAAFDPLGLPMLDLGTAGNVIGFVDVDPARVAEVRTEVPCLANRRFGVTLTESS